VQRPETTIQGYSDRVNHALAFAAKHHDQRVRGGTRPPYFTQPANVGIILTRYGCDDAVVVAGILFDVIEDCVRDGLTRATLERRIGEKFGLDVLDIDLAITQRRSNDQGVELSPDERREDALVRLAGAREPALWVRAAAALHNAATLLADLERTIDPESVWSRFPAGRSGTVRWYRRLYDQLRETGFDALIVGELADVLASLEAREVPQEEAGG
jgi:(p)ppGpp synthase/HD superfamily hydrolase